MRIQIHERTIVIAWTRPTMRTCMRMRIKITFQMSGSIVEGQILFWELQYRDSRIEGSIAGESMDYMILSVKIKLRRVNYHTVRVFRWSIHRHTFRSFPFLHMEIFPFLFTRWIIPLLRCYIYPGQSGGIGSCRI
jgi:hypothetical protein